jgi:hypothetical protein
MYNHKFHHQHFSGFVNEMASLITNKMGGTPKSSYDVFINELSGVFCFVIPKCPSFYPLSGVVNGYNNILLTSSLSYGFNRSHKA